MNAEELIYREEIVVDVSAKNGRRRLGPIAPLLGYHKHLGPIVGGRWGRGPLHYHLIDSPKVSSSLPAAVNSAPALLPSPHDSNFIVIEQPKKMGKRKVGALDKLDADL